MGLGLVSYSSFFLISSRTGCRAVLFSVCGGVLLGLKPNQLLPCRKQRQQLLSCPMHPQPMPSLLPFCFLSLYCLAIFFAFFSLAPFKYLSVPLSELLSALPSAFQYKAFETTSPFDILGPLSSNQLKLIAMFTSPKQHLFHLCSSLATG